MRRFVTILALLALAAPAAAKPVRVFVVNARIELSYAATYADFRDKMFALVDASHPRRAELVQPDVADIASRVRPVDPSAPAARQSGPRLGISVPSIPTMRIRVGTLSPPPSREVTRMRPPRGMRTTMRPPGRSIGTASLGA